MILTNRIAHGVRAGEVTVAYRRWKRPRVKPGSTFRTGAGVGGEAYLSAVEPNDE